MLYPLKSLRRASVLEVTSREAVEGAVNDAVREEERNVEDNKNIGVKFILRK